MAVNYSLTLLQTDDVIQNTTQNPVKSHDALGVKD